MKKKITILIIAIFVLSSIISYYPANTVHAESFFSKVFKLNSDSDEDKSAEENEMDLKEAKKQAKEEKELAEDTWEINQSLLNLNPPKENTVKSWQTSGDKNLPDTKDKELKFSGGDGTKLICAGNETPKKYMYHKETFNDVNDGYREFCMNPGSGGINVVNKSGLTTKTVNDISKEYYRALQEDITHNYSKTGYVYVSDKASDYVGFMGRYANVGKYKGQSIDLYLYVNSVELTSKTYSDGSPKKIKSGITLSKRVGIITSGIDSISITHYFVKHSETKYNTKEKVESNSYRVKGYGQLYDIDSQQGVRFGNNVDYVVYSSPANYTFSTTKAQRSATDLGEKGTIRGISYWTGYTPKTKPYSAWHGYQPADSAGRDYHYLRYNETDGKYLYIYAPGGGNTFVRDGLAWRTGLAIAYSGKSVELTYTFAQGSWNHQNKENWANGYMAIDGDAFFTDAEAYKGVTATNPTNVSQCEQAINNYSVISKGDTTVDGPNIMDSGNTFYFVIKGTIAKSGKATVKNTELGFSDNLIPQFEIVEKKANVYSKTNAGNYSLSEITIEESEGSLKALIDNQSQLSTLLKSDSNLQKGLDVYWVFPVRVKDANFDLSEGAETEKPDYAPFMYQNKIWIPNEGAFLAKIGYVDPKDSDPEPVKTNMAYVGMGVTPVKITINKKSDTGVALAGAEYTIEQSDGNGGWVECGNNPYITEENGRVVTEEIDINPANTDKSFRVTETKAPEGYQMPKGSQVKRYILNFSNGSYQAVDSNGNDVTSSVSGVSVSTTGSPKTATVAFVNTKDTNPVKVKVKVIKKDAESLANVDGGQYSLDMTNVDSTQTSMTQSSGGSFSQAGTMTGDTATIVVRETTPPVGYDEPHSGQPTQHTITFTKSGDRVTGITVDGSSVSVKTDNGAYYAEAEFINDKKEIPPEAYYWVSLKASKQDKETNQYLSGAKINISSPTFGVDTISPTKTTDGSGKVEWKNIQLNNSIIQDFVIREIQPPDEYYSPDSDDPVRYDVNVLPSQKYINYYGYNSSGNMVRSGGIPLKEKLEYKTRSESIPYEVDIYDASGNAVGTETRYREVSVTDTLHYLSIDSDLPIKFINPPKKYVKINILKKDSKSDEKLNGFKFNVKEENSSYSTTLTTGSSGTTTKGEASTGVIQCAQNNKSCSFTITETGQIKNYFAPRGEQVSSYTISMRTGACTINCADGSTVSNTMVVTGAGTKDNPYVLSVPLEFENDEQPPKIRFKVKKKDRTGNLDLSGAEYTVTEAVGNKEWEFTTDANGSFDSGVLEVSEENENAKIIIEETTPPEFYKEPEGKQLKKILLEFRNKSKPNVVSYIKTYGDGSTESGEYKSVGVWPKDDVIELTEAIDSEVEHDTNDAIDFRNTPIPFNVKVEKRASERLDGKIAGLKYGLYDKNGNRFLELTDNKDGTYTAKDIDPTAPGGEFLGYYNFDYVVKEERATVKRELVSWEASFKINTMDSVDYEFTRETNKFPDNPPKRGTVKVIKEDNETGERLQYACYEITANEDILVSDYVDSSQYATLGYDVVAPRDIRAKTGELIVKKGSVVTSANQNLKRGTVVGYLVTDASGEATLADQEVTYESGRKLTVKPLYPGKYKISEVEAPEEYKTGDLVGD